MVNRFLVQLLSTLAINPHLNNLFAGQIYRGAGKKACVPVLNCYSCPAATWACPVGALQSSLSGIAPRFPAYVLGLILLFGLIAGRFICGWLCPFGFIQELIYKLPLPKVIKKSSFTLQLSKLKYLWSLLFVIVLPLFFWVKDGIGIPAFCKYLCPAGTLEGAVPLLLTNPLLQKAAGSITLLKFSLLGILLILMAISFRPFCRWLCPLGAVYGLFNRHSIFSVKVNKSLCINCSICANLCKMDTKIAGDQECISCGDCLPHCPAQAIFFNKPHLKQNLKEDFHHETH